MFCFKMTLMFKLIIVSLGLLIKQTTAIPRVLNEACPDVTGGTCTACSDEATCIAVTCDANKFDTNGIAADGCEAGCAAVPDGTCTACTTAEASGCTDVDCDGDYFFNNNANATDGCEYGSRSCPRLCKTGETENCLLVMEKTSHIHISGPMDNGKNQPAVSYVSGNSGPLVIKSNAFNMCLLINTVHMPTVTIIEDKAFYEVSTMKFVYMPAVTTIGFQAFARSGLINVHMPVVKNIENGAFASCESLLVAGMPVVTHVTNDIFNHCNNLEIVYLSDTIAVAEIFTDAYAVRITSAEHIKSVQTRSSLTTC